MRPSRQTQPERRQLPPGVTPEEAARAKAEAQDGSIQSLLSTIDPKLLNFTGAELDRILDTLERWLDMKLKR